MSERVGERPPITPVRREGRGRGKRRESSFSNLISKTPTSRLGGRRGVAEIERRIAEHEKQHSASARAARYLAAPESVRNAFDAQVREWAAIEREFEEWLADERDYAPLPPRLRRQPEWDERWDRRAEAARKPRPASDDPYDREELLALNLRDLWPGITGEEVPPHGRVTCPSPEHDDQHPACSVRENDWRCFACGASGTIIDVVALVLELEPFGRDFFRVRDHIRGLA